MMAGMRAALAACLMFADLALQAQDPLHAVTATAKRMRAAARGTGHRH